MKLNLIHLFMYIDLIKASTVNDNDIAVIKASNLNITYTSYIHAHIHIYLGQHCERQRHRSDQGHQPVNPQPLPYQHHLAGMLAR